MSKKLTKAAKKLKSLAGHKKVTGLVTSIQRKKALPFIIIFGVIGVALSLLARAAPFTASFEAENGNVSGNAAVRSGANTSGGSYIAFGSGGSSAYAANLQKIKAQPWRNTLEDNSPYRNWPMSEIDKNISILFGPKSAYPFESSVHGQRFSERPLSAGGNNEVRTGCEFSHFAYDDPIVYPNQPEAAHLHMFFGNTDVNAYTTWDTLYNSGGGTCNGGELNRTGYWVPAMFDQNGNVRVPHFMNIYYKNDNPGSHAGQRINYYPDNPQKVATASVVPNYAFTCINEWGGPVAGSVPEWNVLQGHLDQVSCPGGLEYGQALRYLEHNVLFQNCWNGQDASNPNNYVVSDWTYFGGPCPSTHSTRLPNIRYRIRYIVEPGDDTTRWYLSSDVNKSNYQKARGGSTTHGDWWGAWNKQVNRTWVDNCSNVSGASCGYGFLDARSYEAAPNGPALRYRNKYTNAPIKIPAQNVYNALCSHARTLQRTEQAAYCQP